MVGGFAFGPNHHQHPTQFFNAGRMCGIFFVNVATTLSTPMNAPTVTNQASAASAAFRRRLTTLGPNFAGIYQLRGTLNGSPFYARSKAADAMAAAYLYSRADQEWVLANDFKNAPRLSLQCGGPKLPCPTSAPSTASTSAPWQLTQWTDLETNSKVELKRKE